MVLHSRVRVTNRFPLDDKSETEPLDFFILFFVSFKIISFVLIEVKTKSDAYGRPYIAL